MSTTTDAVFADRTDAGRRLAARAGRLRSEAPVVLAIPTGGVPVAAEVAKALASPLDVLVVRKLGRPGHRFGAVAEGGIAVVDHERVRRAGVGAHERSLARLDAEEAADRIAARLRAGRPPYDIVGRTVLIVDDGVGTGDSAIAAARTARHRGAARVVLAVPAVDSVALARLAKEVDEIVFAEVTSAARWYAHGEPPGEREVEAALGPQHPDGRLHLPEGARGAVVVAGGDGLLLGRLHDMGFAALVASGDDIAEAVERLSARPETSQLAVGVLGLGEAADAALGAAGGVRAVVAAGALPEPGLVVLSPATLLVVGGEDRHGLELARATGLPVAVVPGAQRTFAEPGALEQVGHLAGAWFAQHLR